MSKKPLRSVPRSKTIALYRNACPTKSARPRTARRGYRRTATPAISLNGMTSRCRTVTASPGSGSSRWVARRTSSSIRSTMRSAQAQEAAQAEGQPPAEVGRQQILVEKQHGDQAAERRTDPVAAVDGQIRLPAVAGRNQLVDGRVDRGVLSADAHTGDEAGEVEE